MLLKPSGVFTCHPTVTFKLLTLAGCKIVNLKQISVNPFIKSEKASSVFIRPNEFHHLLMKPAVNKRKGD